MSQDNKQIKDGLGDLFTIRMRDLSALGDGSVQRSMILATLFPNDYAAGGGIYSHCAQSGVMLAGLAANSPVYSFRWPAGIIGLVHRVMVNAWCVTTPFLGGVAAFDMFAARNFTAPDTGGNAANFGGNAAKLHTIMASSAASIMIATSAALVPGTRTLDPDPLNRIVAAAPKATDTMFFSSTAIFDRRMGEQPLRLAPNEGFVLRATIPATGAWQFTVTTEWDELPTY